MERMPVFVRVDEYHDVLALVTTVRKKLDEASHKTERRERQEKNHPRIGAGVEAECGKNDWELISG